jgi:hypothetical protein
MGQMLVIATIGECFQKLLTFRQKLKVLHTGQI